MKVHLISIAVISILSSIITTGVMAQYLQRQVVSASGSYTSTEGVSLSWTLAELTMTTQTGEDVEINQGFEQFLQNSITGIDDLKNTSIRLWPNPFEELVEISVLNTSMSEMSIQINRLNGEQFLEEKFSLNTLSINTSQWISGVYIVVISDDRGRRITKKIVKL